MSKSTRPRCTECGALLEYHGEACDVDNIRRHKANVKRRISAKANRAAMADAYASVGMVKVRGNMGGTYWE